MTQFDRIAMFNTMVAEHLHDIAFKLEKDTEYFNSNKNKREVVIKLRYLSKTINELADMIDD